MCNQTQWARKAPEARAILKNDFGNFMKNPGLKARFKEPEPPVLKQALPWIGVLAACCANNGSPARADGTNQPAGYQRGFLLRRVSTTLGTQNHTPQGAP